MYPTFLLQSIRYTECEETQLCATLFYFYSLVYKLAAIFCCGIINAFLVEFIFEISLGSHSWFHREKEGQKRLRCIRVVWKCRRFSVEAVANSEL